MFTHSSISLSRHVLCIVFVFMLLKTLTVYTASLQRTNVNINCLQMDTWDCFNINNGYVQNKIVKHHKNNTLNVSSSRLNMFSNDMEVDSSDKNLDNVLEILNVDKNVSVGLDDVGGVRDREDQLTGRISSQTDNPDHHESSRSLPKHDEEEMTRNPTVVSDSDDYSTSSRTQRFSKKVWLSILSGIILKFATLLPLILGKFTLLASVSLLASKLSLLIVSIMAMRQMFLADPTKGLGFFDNSHGAGQLLYPHQYAQYQQPLSQYGGQSNYPQQPMPVMGYGNVHQVAPHVGQKKWG